jgi:hypothetical protein
MPMNHIHLAVQQAMGESDVRCRHLVAPVVSPVHGHDRDVAGPLATAHAIQKIICRRVGAWLSAI